MNKSILGSYLQHEASIKMNRGGGCRVSDHFGTAGTALHIMQTHYYAQCSCTLHYIAQCTRCLQNNTLLSAMYSANFAGCCNALLCAIYALQVCIATCVNTSRTSSGSLHCIIHRGARIITMHNAPSTTSTNKTPVPHALLLVQIWTNIFQWKSSLALHHNFQKCPWRAGHRSNGAATRNVPCSKKKWVRAIISKQF